jgi:hypothetical protein
MPAHMPTMVQVALHADASTTKYKKQTAKSIYIPAVYVHRSSAPPNQKIRSMQSCKAACACLCLCLPTQRLFLNVSKIHRLSAHNTPVRACINTPLERLSSAACSMQHAACKAITHRACHMHVRKGCMQVPLPTDLTCHRAAHAPHLVFFAAACMDGCGQQRPDATHAC